LGIISDILAQSIAYVDYQKSVGSRPPSSPDLEGILPERLQENNELKPQFDPLRTARFAVYGFCIAPVVGKWFQFLDRRFPLPAAAVAGKVAASPKSAIVATLRRVAVDQAIFAPIGIAIFFTAIGFMEGNGTEGIREKFRDAYLPAFIANYKVWPLMQFINFRFCPLPYRVPFVSTVGIFWNGYLSYLNNAAKEQNVRRLTW